MIAWLVLAIVVGVFAAWAVGREFALREARRLAAARGSALDEQRREAEHLRELQEIRAEAIASVTHELKTPLTSLLGYTTILQKRGDTLTTDQRDEFIAVMDKQGQKVMRLIEDLLQSARIDADGTKLQRVSVDLPEILRRVAREMGVGRGRAIDVDAPTTDIGLFGDPAALEHVITNLLDNALKYSEPDTPVRAAIVEDEGEVVLTVTDEGRGIPADELPNIFERFQQASNARGAGSVGLGLYIVRNLVRAHGGRVWADSDVGKGATFTVVLPRRRARS